MKIVKNIKKFREQRRRELPEEFKIKKKIVAFPNDIGYTGLVVIKDIDVHTMCEHHGVAIEGKIHIGYLPKKNLIGLSQVVRIIESILNVTTMTIQEKATMEIANKIFKIMKPIGLMIIMIAKHNCMCARGVRQRNSKTVTSYMMGKFVPTAKHEFIDLINLE